MTVPAGQNDYQYAELIMHLPAKWPHPHNEQAGDDTFWRFQWLRQVAYYPHLNDTWLGGSRTIIASDDPPVPLGPNTKLTCFLLLADVTEWNPLTLADDRMVHFYTVIPLHTEERDFELRNGIRSLLKRLEARGYAAEVKADRPSVV